MTEMEELLQMHLRNIVARLDTAISLLARITREAEEQGKPMRVQGEVNATPPKPIRVAISSHGTETLVPNEVTIEYQDPPTAIPPQPQPTPQPTFTKHYHLSCPNCGAEDMRPPFKKRPPSHLHLLAGTRLFCENCSSLWEIKLIPEDGKYIPPIDPQK